jgi:hypothetical protein
MTKPLDDIVAFTFRSAALPMCLNVSVMTGAQHMIIGGNRRECEDHRDVRGIAERSSTDDDREDGHAGTATERSARLQLFLELFGVTNINGRILGGVAVGLGLLAWLLFGAPGFTAQQLAGWAPTIVTIPSPAAPNSGEPQLTVSDRGVLLSWIERDGSTTTLRFAERTPTGWTEPRTVGSGENWSVNAIDVPSVLRLADGTLAAHWPQKSGPGMHANDVRLSYSKDSGRTWATSFTPHQGGTHAERLFAFLFQMPGAGLGLIWLEGGTMGTGTGDVQRTVPKHPVGADHAHQQGSGHTGHDGRSAMSGSGTMSVRFATFDTVWKQTAEMPIDLRVCECCPTAAVVTSEGVLAAYRNRSDGEIRDIYVSRFGQGRWSEPAVAHADSWQIPACPINGPALGARGRNVAIAWYTVKQDQGQAYVAFSRDAGRTFGTPTRLDDGGSLGRVDVEVLPDGSALATWIEFAEGRAQFRTRRVTMDGTRSTPVTVAGLAASRASGYPRVAHHGDELVVAWTETASGTQQVRTAIARLPSSVMR